MKVKLADLQKAALAHAAKAREIAELAQTEDRQMTDAEKGDYDTAMAKGREVLENIKAVKADAAVLDAAKSLASDIGQPAVDDVESQGDRPIRERVKSLGLQVIESPEFKALQAKYVKDGRIPERTSISSDPIGIKGLFVGGADTSAGAFVVNEQSGIVEMLGRKPLTIRDLVNVRGTESDTIEYVVQTSHTNAAAVVPEATSSAAPTTGSALSGPLINNPNGGYKPEGSWAFERKTTSVKTIAEWVPATKRALADAKQLEGLINSELRADVAEAEENQILNGNGAGENLTGIMQTSGVQTQGFVEDLFVSVRKAITKARTIGRVAPTGIVLSPLDMEKVDLARDANDRYFGAGPFAMGPRTIWGVPAVESESQPDGTGLLGDFSKAVLWDREQTTVTMTDSHADFFIRNLIAVLAEERVAFGVTRPQAFVKVATA